MDNLILSLDKILKSIRKSCSEKDIIENVFSCFVSLFDTDIVFVDVRNNVFKKSKYIKIDTLCFDIKKIFNNVFDESINMISENQYNEYYIDGYYGIIMPVFFTNKCIGVLFVYSRENFSDECFICLESICMWLSGTIFAFEKDFERKKNDNREIVRSAFGTLSYSEFEAIIGVFSELKGNEGILIMKKISEKISVTRPVIVNALKKMESAGIVESRSLGVKGTYVKVLNKAFLDEIEKIKK